MDLAHAAQGHGDAAAHGLARPLGRVAKAPGPAAETERAGELGGEELVLGPCAFGAGEVVAGLANIGRQLREPSAILGPGTGVERGKATA